ncbi:hypothetical protein GCM10010297_68870 [Streptomyces malachitofuscus]|nr:hypothetical protein GCM10010233_66170 [Streptomyces gancidicus]GGX39359.1 hypothetical protein GCM10010297_68870 [Streptomyces malachitofuscus]
MKQYTNNKYIKVFHASKDIFKNSLSQTVHPTPGPCSVKTEAIVHTNAGGKHQKLILFNLAKAISTPPIIIGKK